MAQHTPLATRLRAVEKVKGVWPSLADGNAPDRAKLVSIRMAQMNALRGLLAEYGEVIGTDRNAVDAGTEAA